MTCPHCQKEMPENHGAVYCPLCGKDLNSTTPAELPPVKIKWSWLLVALLLPPLLTMLSATMMHSFSAVDSSNEGVSPFIGLIGGAIGGTVCGVMLGIKLGRTTGGRIGLSIIFTGILVVACITLCLVGCSVGGYRFIPR